jgi:hypothetical protein
MIQYSDISDLLSEGKTPAQIAALLAVRTVRPIQIADLENYVAFQGIAWRNPITSDWEGPLIVAMQNDAFPAELRGGIVTLLGHVNKPRSTIIDTTQDPWASQASALLPGLLATGILSETQVGEVLALAGGYRYPGVDESAVEWAIELEEKRVVINAARTAVNSRTTTINAWLDAIDMSLSVEEIEAYIADLLSSEDGNPSGGGE